MPALQVHRVVTGGSRIARANARNRSPAVLAALALAAGCHALTDVKTTGTIDETTISGPLGATQRYAGALKLFAAAMPSTVVAGGSLGDELMYASTFSASDWALQTR